MDHLASPDFLAVSHGIFDIDKERIISESEYLESKKLFQTIKNFKKFKKDNADKLIDDVMENIELFLLKNSLIKSYLIDNKELEIDYKYIPTNDEEKTKTYIIKMFEENMSEWTSSGSIVDFLEDLKNIDPNRDHPDRTYSIEDQYINNNPQDISCLLVQDPRHPINPMLLSKLTYEHMLLMDEIKEILLKKEKEEREIAIRLAISRISVPENSNIFNLTEFFETLPVEATVNFTEVLRDFTS